MSELISFGCWMAYLYLNPKQSGPLPPNARDVSDIGHWGTGDLEIALANQKDFDAVKPLITAHVGKSRKASVGVQKQTFAGAASSGFFRPSCG
ncbi:hypothetical protein AVMA1855_18130 [Acidovorax sp. SUPP1855]|uniref:hypothetical protein n=1 Tax=Acidovorax sp. SUPP1855 TaxID=431774 RepID=UPI0023DE21CE|nr:hypothetical protein [Acidovorax sp. SUPP1855]GKS86100.1 hypothetical protein AVMA1855_18130 [Acidovorax sp. SUPP1855]